MPDYIHFDSYATNKAISVFSLVFANANSMDVSGQVTIPIPSGRKCTYDDWGLLPAQKPFIALPPYKENFVDVPGANGSIDAAGIYNLISTIDEPLYGLREGSWEFYVEKYKNITETISGQSVTRKQTFEELKREIANYLHGQRKIVALTSDPYVFYKGRFSIDDMHTDEYWSVITIKYTIDPYGKVSNVRKADNDYTETL